MKILYLKNALKNPSGKVIKKDLRSQFQDIYK